MSRKLNDLLTKHVCTMTLSEQRQLQEVANIALAGLDDIENGYDHGGDYEMGYWELISMASIYYSEIIKHLEDSQQ